MASHISQELRNQETFYTYCRDGREYPSFTHDNIRDALHKALKDADEAHKQFWRQKKMLFKNYAETSSFWFFCQSPPDTEKRADHYRGLLNKCFESCSDGPGTELIECLFPGHSNSDKQVDVDG